MDQELLVTGKLAAGDAFLKKLVDLGFDVVLAFWWKNLEDEGKPMLCIFSRHVDDHGAFDAYIFAHDLLRADPEIGIDPFEFNLYGSSHPWVEASRRLREGRLTRPFVTLTGTFEGAASEMTFYPSPATATA